LKCFCLLVLESSRKVGKIFIETDYYQFEKWIIFKKALFFKNNPKDKKVAAVKYIVTNQLRLA
jgi:hypothetical protein